MIVRRAVAAALVVATLVVGGLISDHIPDVDAQQQPFIRTGSVGVPVAVRTFDATVLSVRGAGVIKDDHGTHDTSGVWILVKVRLAAVTKPVALSYAALGDARGRTYLASTRFEQPLVDGGRMLEPGIPVTGEIAFEVPLAATAHLSLRLAIPAGLATDLRMAAVAEIPLPVDAGKAEQWKAQKTPVTIADPVAAR